MVIRDDAVLEVVIVMSIVMLLVKDNFRQNKDVQIKRVLDHENLVIVIRIDDSIRDVMVRDSVSVA